MTKIENFQYKGVLNEKYRKMTKEEAALFVMCQIAGSGSDDEESLTSMKLVHQENLKNISYKMLFDLLGQVNKIENFSVPMLMFIASLCHDDSNHTKMWAYSLNLMQIVKGQPLDLRDYMLHFPPVQVPSAVGYALAWEAQKNTNWLEDLNNWPRGENKQVFNIPEDQPWNDVPSMPQFVIDNTDVSTDGIKFKITFI